MAFLRDLRYGIRALWRYPSFAVSAAAVVVLGIGASTAVFTVVRSVLLVPLPYRDVDRLVLVLADGPGIDRQPALTAAEFLALRDRTDLFEEVGTANGSPASLTGVDHMERIAAASVSDNFLALFGVAPAAGRVVSSATDVGPDWVRAVDISDDLWERRWRRDPTLIGRVIEVNNLKMTVVGVMPKGFRLFMGEAAGIAPRVDVWYPGAPDVGSARACPVVARLRSGVRVEAAQAAVAAFMSRYVAEHPARYRAGAVRLTLSPLASEVVRSVRPSLVALAAAVGFVLLVACANVMNLLLVRATSRGRELAIRMAIGASRRHLVRQLTAEAIVLGGVGAAGGLLAAQWGVDALLALAPAALPRRETIAIDGVVALFAVLASLAASLLFGVVPAWQATRGNAAAAMKAEAGSTPAGATLRGLLVAAQIALSLALLAGAGLMAKTFAALRDVPLGFDPRDVVAMKVDLPPMRFKTAGQRMAFYDAALEAIRGMPGVESVGIGLPAPLGGRPVTERIAAGPGQQERLVSAFGVFSGFAETLRVPLRAGRLIGEADHRRADTAVMVDVNFAAALWPGVNPLGRHVVLRPSSKAPVDAEVVGVVDHVQSDDLRNRRSPQIWMPYTAMPWDMDVVVRSRRDPREVGAAVRRAIETLQPGRPVFGLRPLADDVADASADTRFALFVLGAFALVSVALTASGVYGVVAFATARRARELAIRLALGAAPRRVALLVVRDSAGWIAIGLAAGALGGRALARSLGGLLFGVAPGDAPTFAGVAVLLAAVALAASAVPAVRAARADLLASLRTD